MICVAKRGEKLIPKWKNFMLVNYLIVGQQRKIGVWGEMGVFISRMKVYQDVGRLSVEKQMEMKISQDNELQNLSFQKHL